MKTILITGATGFIGSRLATLALERGYGVKTLTRSDWITLPAVPIEQRYFGSLPAQIPLEALQGVDVVVHCAAEIEANERSAYAVNVEGTWRLAQLAAGAGGRTFIFLSSQSARRDALSAYGRTKYAAEQKLLSLDKLNVIILRPGLVTGPGSRGLFQRLSHMVETLPLLLLLGGGQALVQPIHVDDLGEAIFRCAERGDELHQAVLKLGDSAGVSLAEFLQALALTRLGRRKMMVSIPLGPIESVVKLAEGIRLPLPINRSNLQGLKLMERMETAADMARLGLKLRPALEVALPVPSASRAELSLKERATQIILIGAGRVGLVHAVTLSRFNGVKLSGLVDPNVKATQLFKGMGLPAPTFRSLDEALVSARPDAAVIATPVFTHLPLTRVCLQNGLTVMVEKPLALQPGQLAEYEQLAQEFPEQPVQVGYVMLRNPQVFSCLNRLKAGEFGQIRGFMGITLNSFIHKTVTDRWEVQKDKAGGGVLTNFGGHVLSMIWAAFGHPQAVEAQSAKLFSTEVEDSIVVKFDYPEFSGTHYCSWSIQGYPRQENKLVIWTERGQLILTGSVGIFVSGSRVDLVHQLDFDLGFNIAPDYAGGGFTTEFSDLKRATLTRQPAPVSLEAAIQIERLLFKVYEVAREVKTFRKCFKSSAWIDKTRLPLPDSHIRQELLKHALSPYMPAYEGALSQKRHVVEQERNQANLPRILDLRELSVEKTLAYLDQVTETSAWAGYLLTPAQVRRVSPCWVKGERLRVTVPDFLYLARLLSTREYQTVLKLMGWRGLLSAGLAIPLIALRERGLTFWAAAVGLLAASLQSTVSEFAGTLLLHPYLTDFALSLRRLDLLEHMLKICRQVRPRARIGFQTNMAAEALNVLWRLETRVDEVSVLSSPGALKMEMIFKEMRQASGHTDFKITTEVGLAPYIVHQTAFDAPHCWAFGADTVLIGPGADPTLAAQRQLEVEQEWGRAFPGLAMPEGVL